MKLYIRLIALVLCVLLLCPLLVACGGPATVPPASDGDGENDGPSTPDTGNPPVPPASDGEDGDEEKDDQVGKDPAPDKEPDRPTEDPALSDIAKNIVASFGRVPDAWQFLPPAFSAENYTVDPGVIPTYLDFTNTAAIPRNYIGKQMNVVIGMLNTCETVLGYVNTVYGALNMVESAYQVFINDHPDNYAQFAGEVGSFSYEISLDGKMYFLSARIENVRVTLFSNGEDTTYGARIQFGNNNVLKYTVSENGLKIALRILNVSSTQIEFVRDRENAGAVTGYIYEYLTVGGKDLVATSTLLYTDADYTVVVGNKGDFIPTADARNCEVYRSRDGRFVGSEVRESLGDGKKTYDTLWYALSDIAGIQSVRKVDEYNGVNPDTVYINGKSESIHSMFVGLLDTSRRFDIEFKKVTSYVYDAANGAYTAVEYEVPMMFIQEGNADTFAEDYAKKNDVSVFLSVSASDRHAVHEGYHVLAQTYDRIKDLVTNQSITAYCAEDFVPA